MSEWQDISTAPKDGKDIPCLTPSYSGPVMLRWVFEAWRDWDGDSYTDVTHWFDLPDLPGEES